MAPELILSGVVLLALCAYAVLGGADFGAGIWEFTTSLDPDPRDKRLIARAIGPVWEANHVWLIFVLVLLFSGFPLVFAALSRALWIPLLLALAGIIFRGAGFVFRAYAPDAKWFPDIAGAIFGIASSATPFFLGAGLGAMLSGDLPVQADGSYRGNSLIDWITPLSLYSGILGVGLCAYLAAVFLSREAAMTDDEELERNWRRRGQATGIWIGLLSMLGLVFCAVEAPHLWSKLLSRGWFVLLLSAVSGSASLWMLHVRKFMLANVLSAIAVGAVIVGAEVANYPYFFDPTITIESSKAPAVVLWTLIGCIGLGLVILLPSLWWLLAIFKSEAWKPSSDS